MIVEETWSCHPQTRVIERVNTPFVKPLIVVQQLWIGSLGGKEWVDMMIKTED